MEGAGRLAGVLGECKAAPRNEMEVVAAHVGLSGEAHVALRINEMSAEGAGLLWMGGRMRWERRERRWWWECKTLFV